MSEPESLLCGMFVFFVLPALVWWIVLAVRLARSTTYRGGKP